MEISGWLIFILLVQVIHGIGTWKLYVKAGRKAWEAFVPVYNGIVLMQIINRPKWWILLLFIPVINLFLFPIIWIETLRTFGKKSTADMVFGVVTLGLYIAYVNYTHETTYHANRDLKAPNKTMDTLGSISFAVVVATLVHTYFIQPYTIPTSSLEKTLLVGDFLFVSKMHYGPRIPMTTVAAPMVHDTIPIIKSRSYLNKPQLPYIRIPGFEEIKNNDIVVFNWPADTVRKFFVKEKGVIKPRDKKSNYVKRCVGIPGDELEIKNGYVYIDGKQNSLPDRAKLQFRYKIVSKSSFVKRDNSGRYLNQPSAFVSSHFDISDIYISDIDRKNKIITHIAQLTDEAYQKVKNNPNVIEVEKLNVEEGTWNQSTFPQDPRFKWNTKFFGPITIPEAGESTEITIENIALYKRIIEVYEGSEFGIQNKISLSGTQVKLNGKILTEYTFLQDYYWMMGDNRDNSQDARMWGFVPFNHVVGKPVFIWMSWDSNAEGFMNKIRWERLFTTVGGEGKPVSYFIYFVVLLGAWFIFDFFRKRKA